MYPKVKEAYIINIQGKEYIKVVFPYSKYTVEQIKSLPYAEYQTGKYWIVKLHKYAVKRLKKWGFFFHPDLTKWYEEQKTYKKMELMEVHGLENILRPYQKQAINFIEKNGGNCLIADDMGLGKTWESLAWIKLNQHKLNNIVILCPSIVKLQWSVECQQFLNPTIYILKGFPKNGVKPTDFLIKNGVKNFNIFICNYEIWRNRYKETTNNHFKELKYTGWADYLADLNIDLIIADEAHKLGNTSSNLTKTTKRIVKNVKYFLPLTGTPSENRPIQLFPLLNMLRPDLFPDWYSYAKRYCALKRTSFCGKNGWDDSGSSNLDELHEILTEIMIRRLKSEVTKELPKVQETILNIEIENMEEYNKQKKLISKGKLRQVILEGKLKAAAEWIDTYLENGGKLLVFAHHKKAIDYLMKEFSGVIKKVDGSLSEKQKNGAKMEFISNPKIKILIGNIKSAGTGLDGLQKVCDTGLFVEIIYNPKLIEQAIGRLDRIGQLNMVNIYFMIATNTYDEDILKIIEKKNKIVDKTIDGK